MQYLVVTQLFKLNKGNAIIDSYGTDGISLLRQLVASSVTLPQNFKKMNDKQPTQTKINKQLNVFIYLLFFLLLVVKQCIDDDNAILCFFC